MTHHPFLTRPDERYKTSFIAAMREFQQEGRNPGWKLEMLAAHFDEWVDMERSKETAPLEGYVPETVYWLIVAGQYAGRISIRQQLTPALRKYGGHIGYDIRPSMRRKGYGTLQCRLALEKAKARGMEHILITCDDDNIGSAKIIEANGGILQDKIDVGRHALTRRYWIDLTAADSSVIGRG